MAFDSYLYMDPEKVAIRREEDALRKHRACGDCVHRRSVEFQGETWNGCEYKRHQYGRRCDLHETQKVEP